MVEEGQKDVEVGMRRFEAATCRYGHIDPKFMA